MNFKRLFIAIAVILGSIGFAARAQEQSMNYVQVAEIEIDPAQLEDYKAAVKEQIETAIRVEPGVLTLYAVSDKDNPTRVMVFEVYANVSAYRSHLETAHFKKYKTTTASMVKALKLNLANPIKLGTK
jgi:quinol monooxygenase YgiN